MSDEVLATDRLERSAGRLEKAVTERIAAAEKAVADRVAALEAEVDALKSQLEGLQVERDSLSAGLDDWNVEYRILENVTDTVLFKLWTFF